MPKKKNKSTKKELEEDTPKQNNDIDHETIDDFKEKLDLDDQETEKGLCYVGCGISWSVKFCSF